MLLLAANVLDEVVVEGKTVVVVGACVVVVVVVLVTVVVVVVVAVVVVEVVDVVVVEVVVVVFVVVVVVVVVVLVVVVEVDCVVVVVEVEVVDVGVEVTRTSVTGGIVEVAGSLRSVDLQQMWLKLLSAQVISRQKLGNFGRSVVIGSKLGGKLANWGRSPRGWADFTPGELSIRRGLSSGTIGAAVVGTVVVVVGTAVVVVGTRVVVEVMAAGRVANAGKIPRFRGCDGPCAGCNGPCVGKAT